MNRIQKFIYCLVGTSLLTSQVQAENIDPTSLSIEQLMESEVSSVTRTDQKFSDTAAAVYVVTQDDIQRSGVTNIPDVLRMVPGIQVARISADSWAVSARGFNGSFANKLLVLLDGSTVYSPTFAGVRWENLGLVLEDIERIEVIRGPGASAWGQNAVNGVINIITKHAEDTQQGMVSVAAGNEEHANVALRYGGRLGDNLQYRMSGKFLQRDSFVDLRGKNARDDTRHGRGDFRMDWNSNAGDRVMFKASGFVSELDASFKLPIDTLADPVRKGPKQNSGGSIQARWEHDISVASKTNTQFYYEYFNAVNTVLGSEKTHTFDFDFQHDIALSKDNNFNWGFGYRFVSNFVADSIYTTFRPNQQNLNLASAFIQDSIAFFDNALLLTLGTKIQYYTLSGWDYQPSARLLWKLHPKHRVWTSFSRATRVPSRGETAIGIRPIPVPNPIVPNLSIPLALQPNPKLKSERVLSYELGYRAWISRQFSWDLALFYNDYKDLIRGSNSFPVSLINEGVANTWGIEAATDWRPTDALRLQISYSFLQTKYNNFSVLPDASPENQFSFRGAYDITSTVAFDVWVRYVDSFLLQKSPFSQNRNIDIIDDYVGLDLRLAWKPKKNLELSIVGQNLNNKAHFEFADDFFAYPRQLERSFFGRIRWTFD